MHEFEASLDDSFPETETLTAVPDRWQPAVFHSDQTAACRTPIEDPNNGGVTQDPNNGGTTEDPNNGGDTQDPNNNRR